MGNFLTKFKSPGLGKKTKISCFLILFFGLFFSRTPIARMIEAQTSGVLKFQLRSTFRMDPEIDSRIKVVVFDDDFISRFGSYDSFSKEYWNSFLNKLTENNPRSIVIDGLLSDGKPKDDWYWFDGPYGKPFHFSRAVNVFSGVALFQSSQGQNLPAHILAPLEISGIAQSKQMFSQNRKSNLSDVHSQGALAIDPFWNGLIRAVGHISYDKNTGRFDPIKQIQDFGVLPHLGIVSSGEWEIRNDRLWINGYKLKLNDGGNEINFPSPEAYRKRQHSASSILSAIVENRKIDWIESGDIVFIAPLMWTGHTDKGWTPFGNQHGSLHLLSILNSALTGKWINEPMSGIIAIAILALAAYSILFFVPFSYSGISLIVLLFSWIFLGLLIFSFFSISVPIFYPLSIVGFSAAILYARKIQIEELSVQSLKQALVGKLSDGEVELSLSRKFHLRTEPEQYVISILFIDIVGYSAISQDLSPLEAFHDLKGLLEGMREIIHKHDGVVDKTLGDGLLAYFGYSILGGRVLEDHASKAVKSALEIQEKSLRRIANQTSDRVYPLRIGINTTTCLIGNLGTEQQLDVTLVGHGVNMAKRLEGSAEPHHIVMSSLTWELVAGEYHHAKVTRKEVQMKYHDRPQEAVELRPPIMTDEEYDQVKLKTENLTMKRRLLTRFDVKKLDFIYLKDEQNQFSILNFSMTGLRVRSPRFYQAGAKIRCGFRCGDFSIQNKIDECLAKDLEFVVRWVVKDGQQAVLGLSLETQDVAIQDNVFDLLCQHLI